MKRRNVTHWSCWPKQSPISGVKKTKTACAALVLLSLASAASANVTYTCETVTASSTITSAAGRLEIMDAAWAAGQASYTAAPTCASLTNCDYGNPSSPMVQFSFRVNAPNPTAADIDLNLVEGTGLVFPLNDWFRASFTIQGSTLNLNVFANTGETDMRMISNTITRFGSDSHFSTPHASIPAVAEQPVDGCKCRRRYLSPAP